MRECNGLPCKSWDTASADKKQIYSTRSVSELITELSTLALRTIYDLIINCSELMMSNDVINYKDAIPFSCAYLFLQNAYPQKVF